jgi:hypothetical protein
MSSLAGGAARPPLEKAPCSTYPRLALEDLFVVVADTAWKGKRSKELEERIVSLLSQALGKPGWEVFVKLDEIISKLAARADARLAWQGRYPI